MSDSLFLNNSNYVKSVELLLQLHDLIAKEQGDSDAADVVRDEMELLWRGLDPEEARRVGRLAAETYMLLGREVFERVDATERTRERLGLDLEAAWQARDWDRVLELLRRGPDFLTVDQLAYLRGRCWLALGHPEVATRFFEFALRLQPTNAEYRLASVEALLTLGQADVARDHLHAGAAQADSSVRQWFTPLQSPVAVA
jgi:hypothetical protein